MQTPFNKQFGMSTFVPLGLKYVKDEGDIIGIDEFGKSAPGDELMKEYGFTVENVVKMAKALLSKKQ